MSGQITALLLKAGEDVNVPDKERRTALQKVCNAFSSSGQIRIDAVGGRLDLKFEWKIASHKDTIQFRIRSGDRFDGHHKRKVVGTIELVGKYVGLVHLRLELVHHILLVLGAAVNRHPSALASRTDTLSEHTVLLPVALAGRPLAADHPIGGGRSQREQQRRPVLTQVTGAPSTKARLTTGLGPQTRTLGRTAPKKRKIQGRRCSCCLCFLTLDGLATLVATDGKR